MLLLNHVDRIQVCQPLRHAKTWNELKNVGHLTRVLGMNDGHPGALCLTSFGILSCEANQEAWARPMLTSILVGVVEGSFSFHATGKGQTKFKLSSQKESFHVM